MKAQEITKIHIDSFDYAMTEGLNRLSEYLLPCEAEVPVEDTTKVYKLWIERLQLGHPYKSGSFEAFLKDSRLFPAEARLRSMTYSAPLVATVARQIEGNTIDRLKVNLGFIPIMVRSKNCHLSKLTQEEMVRVGEDIQELGGYFIINGVEKLIRLLIVQKQNYPVAMYRPSYANRGPKYTHYGVCIRCIRDDLFTQSVTVHYLSDGNCTVSFRLRRGEFIIPALIVLKALSEVSDKEIYTRLVSGKQKETHIRAEVLIRDGQKYGIYTRAEALTFIGEKCKRNMIVTSSMTDEEIGQLVLEEHVFVHLTNRIDKLNLLLLMIKKNYSLAEGEILPEGTDTISTQDFLLPGHLILNILKEKIEDTLESVKNRLIKESSKGFERLRDSTLIQKIIEQHAGIGKKLENFLATGNLSTRTGLDLLQDKGFSIIAEKINYARFISHFHSVHRGSYFTEMKISSVRKLLPEAWGFICPVHTPDGSPCGLLSHITSGCRPMSKNIEFDMAEYTNVLANQGMLALEKNEVALVEHTPVLLDGKLIGTVEHPAKFVNRVRRCKQHKELNKFIEIAYLPGVPLFEGVFIFTKEGRLMRIVKNLKTQKIEWVGPLEQLSLSIACVQADIRPDTTHIEVSPLSVLSHLAIATPFSDHNQSPRNMYQCQMAKQTMGTAVYNYKYRTDTKIYRLVTPQAPLVSCQAKQVTQYGFPLYPSGTNAVVAIISYTGYDMEDAMIINKAAYERGMAHGIVYKTNIREVNEREVKFSLIKDSTQTVPKQKGLDLDGVRPVGATLAAGSPEMALFNKTNESIKYFDYKDTEPCKVEDVFLVGDSESESKFQVLYKYRYTRNPTVGDKFSSRHGQKGVLSILWPQEDMPFTESGITPDIIMNPHAYPSRMTIGMLIESIAGKVGASEGQFQDARPFQDTDKVAYFGEKLVESGFSYYGSERMYSGILGTELKADIFIGLVYYQRLRHMVSDKYQARATGPVDVLTKQPIKGRKRHGGIRLGEMERDSLLAHGASFWLYDRLMTSSDYSEGFLCQRCGSILSCYLEVGKDSAQCKVCGVTGVKIAIPYVLRYLTNELAAMNIKLKFNQEAR